MLTHTSAGENKITIRVQHLFTIPFVFSLRVYNPKTVAKYLCHSPPLHCGCYLIEIELVYLLLFIFHLGSFPPSFSIILFIMFFLNMVVKVKTMQKRKSILGEASISSSFLHANTACYHPFYIGSLILIFNLCPPLFLHIWADAGIFIFTFLLTYLFLSWFFFGGGL